MEYSGFLFDIIFSFHPSSLSAIIYDSTQLRLPPISHATWSACSDYSSLDIALLFLLLSFLMTMKIFWSSYRSKNSFPEDSLTACTRTNRGSLPFLRLQTFPFGFYISHHLVPISPLPGSYNDIIWFLQTYHLVPITIFGSYILNIFFLYCYHSLPIRL